MAGKRESRKRLVVHRTVREVDDSISFVLAEKERQIQRIADEVRRKVVLPACVRFGLTYTAGNGTFAFGDPRQRDYNHPRYAIGTEHDARAARLAGLVDVIKLLDTPVDTESRAVLGFYVHDVTVADLERARAS